MTDRDDDVSQRDDAEAQPEGDAVGTGTAGAATADDADGGAPRRHLKVWQESLLLVGLALVLAILIKTFLVQAFYIPSASMEPGLQEDDRILVQKPSYWFGEPERGDVVVFEDPGGWLGVNEDTDVDGLRGVMSKIGLYPTGGHLVKRVVGVAGDTVHCCDDAGRIEVNGVALDESEFLAERPENVQCDGPMKPTCDWTAGPVPDGALFVMGDNRSASADSSERLCMDTETDCTRDPYVQVDEVVGKVWAVVWPRAHWSVLNDPSAFDDVPAGD